MDVDNSTQEQEGWCPLTILNKKKKKRRWEDMDQNILILIFKLVCQNSEERQQLLVNVSAVCRSWECACWEILFWNSKNLDLSNIKFYRKVRSMDEVNPFAEANILRLMKSIVEGDEAHATPPKGWSQSIRLLAFPTDVCTATDAALLMVAKRTPHVQKIIFGDELRLTRRGFLLAITHWKEVTSVTLGKTGCRRKMDLYTAMARIWNNLEYLVIMDIDVKLRKENSVGLVESFPKLKKLYCRTKLIYDRSKELVAAEGT